MVEPAPPAQTEQRRRWRGPPAHGALGLPPVFIKLPCGALGRAPALPLPWESPLNFRDHLCPEG